MKTLVKLAVVGAVSVAAGLAVGSPVLVGAAVWTLLQLPNLAKASGSGGVVVPKPLPKQQVTKHKVKR
jgi:hypothetical protein